MRFPKLDLSPKRWFPRAFQQGPQATHVRDPESDATKAVLRDMGGSRDDSPLTPTQLRSTSDVLMPLRIQEHGLDPDYVAVVEPDIYKALEETCAHCGSKRQCARDLSKADADNNLNAYCANTEALDRLLVRK